MLPHRLRNQFSPLASLLILACSLAALPATAATFGKVVSIGGHAADIALDEGRGVLYIANYTSSRIDVMSTTDFTIGRSISVPAYPGGVAMSPNGRYLLVTHYASTAGSTLSQPGQNAITVIDLTNNAKRTYGVSSGPVGAAFGIDGLALILTQDEFLLFDPVSGVTTSLATVGNVKSQTLPVDQENFPPQILAGSLTATSDGRHHRNRWDHPGYGRSVQLRNVQL
jgi:DNA-binding beta-propeller fold protein YncE